MKTGAGVLAFSSMMAVILLISGCGGNKVGSVAAKKGDTVKVHYTGKLDDGTVFDSSQGRSPLQFVLGAGNVIEGFDEGVTGMKVGESKTVKIPAEKAYGPHCEDLVFRVSPDKLPAGSKHQIGQKYQMGIGGATMTVRVTAVTGEAITLDGNHDLAGKDLTFEVKLVEIKAGKD